jgi:uncharacterized integral membrane protein
LGNREASDDDAVVPLELAFVFVVFVDDVAVLIVEVLVVVLDANLAVRGGVLRLIGVMYSLPLSVAVFLVVVVGMLLIVDFMAELLDNMMNDEK